MHKIGLVDLCEYIICATARRGDRLNALHDMSKTAELATFCCVGLSWALDPCRLTQQNLRTTKSKVQ
jgi:hypothetical protein